MIPSTRPPSPPRHTPSNLLQPLYTHHLPVPTPAHALLHVPPGTLVLPLSQILISPKPTEQMCVQKAGGGEANQARRQTGRVGQTHSCSVTEGLSPPGSGEEPGWWKAWPTLTVTTSLRELPRDPPSRGRGAHGGFKGQAELCSPTPLAPTGSLWPES